MGVNEDDHIKPSGSITIDTGNTAIIMKADDTHMRKEMASERS